MRNTKILFSVVSGLVVVGSFVTPAFAGDDKNNDHMMNHDQMQYSKEHNSDDMRSSDNNWWNKNWKNKWDWNMRDEDSDRNLSANMSGRKEVPGPGDENGRGDAQVKVKPGKGEVCVEMWVKNIDPASAAHIHRGDRNTAGPVVISLPTPNADGYTNGCVSEDKDLLKTIKKNSSEYYVNVHNAAYPNGAVRGQLQN